MDENEYNENIEAIKENFKKMEKYNEELKKIIKKLKEEEEE